MSGGGGDGGNDGLQLQLESFRESDAQRDALLQRIVDEYRRLEERHREVLSDLDNEKTSRRHWQKQHAIAFEEIHMMRQRTEGSPFVLALIDGDGAIFQESFLKAGAAGGSEAAYQLVTEIKNHLQKLPDVNSHWPIITHVYANFEGLSKKLTQVGIFKSPNELHAFACAFSFHQPLFNLIDVGSGKERADHKIEEMFRLFVSNSHCKHIIFGGCHDNGYLPNLESYRRDQSFSSRMTLLEATPAEPGFRHLGIPLVQFDTVFRTEALPDPRLQPERTQSSQLLPIHHSQSLSGQSTATQNGHLNGATSETSSPKQSHVTKPAASGSSPATAPSVPAQPPTTSPAPLPAPSTYATVGKLESDNKEFSIVPSKPSAQRKVVYLNSKDYRIDQPIQRPDATTWEKLNNRIKQQKVCNHFHLMGKCKNGNNCYYSHEPRLTQKEQMALRSRARTTPCPNGGDCRDVECYLGHVCPTDDCQHLDCRFGDLHNIDNTLYAKMYEDGHIEIVR